LSGPCFLFLAFGQKRRSFGHGEIGFGFLAFGQKRRSFGHGFGFLMRQERTDVGRKTWAAREMPRGDVRDGNGVGRNTRQLMLFAESFKLASKTEGCFS